MAAFEGREEKKRWHIRIENTVRSAEQGTKASVEREDGGGAKVNTTSGEKRATGEHHEK